jgi:phosphoglycerate dehydrogenase-like enzyme
MTNKPKVLVDPSFRKMNEIFSAADLEALSTMVDVLWGQDSPMPLELARETLADAVAVVCADWRYGDALSAAPNLRAILTVSGGFPNALDWDQCFRRNIRILSAAPAFGRAVAEMALGMALAGGRDIVSADRAMRAGVEGWQHQGNVGIALLFGKPVGFIGYGTIARCLRPLIEPFGCPISVYDPWQSERTLRRQGLTPASLEHLMEHSKVIFVLAAPTMENRALLSRDLLERVQSGAILVLVSRAHVVDFAALTDLVLRGRFKAAIDVFPTEPLELNHPIRRAEGAILSAHRAGAVQEALHEIGQMVVDDLEAIVRGFPPQRMQIIQPELVARYASNAIPTGLDSK